MVLPPRKWHAGPLWHSRDAKDSDCQPGTPPDDLDGAQLESTKLGSGQYKSTEAEQTYWGPRLTDASQTCSGYPDQAQSLWQHGEAPGWGSGLRKWGPDGQKSSRSQQRQSSKQDAQGGRHKRKPLAFGGAHVLEVLGEDAAIEDAALGGFLQSMLKTGTQAPFSLMPHVWCAPVSLVASFKSLVKAIAIRMMKFQTQIHPYSSRVK